MFLNPRPILILLCLGACASPPAPKVLTPLEQIAVDTERAQGLADDFKRKVKFLSAPRLERYLTRTAVKVGSASKTILFPKIEVRIHLDSEPGLSRAFSFPGVLISVPLGFLREVDYENELAALFAYELAHVMNRHLANRVEAGGADLSKNGLILFGEGSVFSFDAKERTQSIELGTDLLYWSGYDVRGMASMFRQHPLFFGNPGSESGEKAVGFNVREALRARSDLVPSLNPIVRSAEFIQFKKELGRIQR